MDPILLVDDEKDNLQALQRLLRNLFEVTVCTSPFEALRLIQSQSFHVVVSDQRMPEMTGVELLEKAKRLSPACVRILLTGYTDIESVIDAINRGNIYRYIAKPWDPEDLKLTLKQANETYLLRKEIEDKNAELIQKNEALSSALSELKVLDQAKSRFLSLISHELNTPLTVLNGFTSLLEDNKKTLSQDLQKAVSGLSGSALRFQEIVSEALDYVRVASATQIQRASVTPYKGISEVCEKLKGEAEKKKVKLKQGGDKNLNISVDPIQFSTAVEKILRDCVTRVPAGSEISIGVEKNADGKTVVRFEGQGIPPDESAFRPLDISGNPLHHHRNLGLGLAIAALIAEAHGGVLKAEASGKNMFKMELAI